MPPKKYTKLISYQGPSNLNNIVPDKIKCCRCNVVKSSSSYSKIRRDELKAHIARYSRFNAVVQAVVPCSSCTGGQRLEHTCSDCGKTKSTDTGFSKAQLKKADDALCVKCSDRINNLGIGGKEEDDDEDEDGSGDESEGDSSDWENAEWGSTMASGVALRSATGNAGSTGSTFPGSCMPSLSHSFVPAGSDRASMAGTVSTARMASTVGKASGLPSGFNANSYGKPKSSVGGGSRKGASRGFAKIRKGNPRPDRYWEQEGGNEDDDDKAIHSDDSEW